MNSAMQPISTEWWQGDGLQRFLADLIGGELARMRKVPVPPHGRWTDDIQTGPGGIDVDSLERLRLAMAVAEALDFHSSG